MKKLLIGLLMCAALTLSACGSKLTECAINDSDSAILKDYKTLYNLDLKEYNQKDLQEKLFETWEREAKAHPKDNMGVILVRASVNYIDFTKDTKDAFSDKELMQTVLDNLLEQNKELKKCDESEFKNFKKISNEKLAESRKLQLDSYNIRNKSKELADFDKEFNHVTKEALKSMTKGKSISEGITGEEFLKMDYKKLWKETRKKQEKALEDMNKKIIDMK